MNEMDVTYSFYDLREARYMALGFAKGVFLSSHVQSRRLVAVYL